MIREAVRHIPSPTRLSYYGRNDETEALAQLAGFTAFLTILASCALIGVATGIIQLPQATTPNTPMLPMSGGFHGVR